MATNNGTTTAPRSGRSDTVTPEGKPGLMDRLRSRQRKAAPKDDKAKYAFRRKNIDGIEGQNGNIVLSTFPEAETVEAVKAAAEKGVQTGTERGIGHATSQVKVTMRGEDGSGYVEDFIFGD